MLVLTYSRQGSRIGLLQEHHDRRSILPANKGLVVGDEGHPQTKNILLWNKYFEGKNALFLLHHRIEHEVGLECPSYPGILE